MKLISNKHCIIGEGPIWNENERKLYLTNGMGFEICMLDIYTGTLTARKLDVGVAAIAFDRNNRIIVSRKDGVFILNDDNTTNELYDTKKFKISYANDMKVGPDGRIYVGTQSSRRIGVSDDIDGKLYSIDKNGNVRILLDNIQLSNGLDWSMDEKRLYHTDSDTNIIKEYDFDKASGNIAFTSRQVEVCGVDGFTIDKNDNIFAACWGQGHIAVIDTATMKIIDHIPVGANIPASCTFCGDDMDILAVVTASYGADLDSDTNAGCTFIKNCNTSGRKPYIFG